MFKFQNKELACLKNFLLQCHEMKSLEIIYLVDGVNDTIGGSNISLHHLDVHPSTVNVKITLLGPEPYAVLGVVWKACLLAVHLGRNR